MNKNKNKNTEIIDSKHQTIETKDYYIEAPNWISPDILNDTEFYCTQQIDNDSDNSACYDDIDLFKNNYIDINLNTESNKYKDANSNVESNNYTELLFNLKNKINNKNNVDKKIKVAFSKYLYLLIPFCIIPTLNIANTALNKTTSIISETINNKDNTNYTFSAAPTEIVNLSNMATTVDSNEFTNDYLYKKGVGNNEVVCLKHDNEEFALIKFDNEGKEINKFNLKLNDDNSIYVINDIIELPNKDLIINATLDKNEIFSNTILHYNKNGHLKTQKLFSEETTISNLYNQPDSENYFFVSQDSTKATINKLTGNGNKVFEYIIEKDFLQSISIFPVNKDLHVFYTYYNDENNLVFDTEILNAFGKTTFKKEMAGINMLLLNGIYTEDNKFLFEESKLYISDIDKNNTVKINSNGYMENTSIEEFDFYSNNIFKLDNGFISVRETVLTPNEDEYTSFSILTFVKFDKNGQEEWRKYVNYYDENENPITSNRFIPDHIYLQNNKVIIEGSEKNKFDDFEYINFSIDSEGNISKINK